MAAPISQSALWQDANGQSDYQTIRFNDTGGTSILGWVDSLSNGQVLRYWAEVEQGPLGTPPVQATYPSVWDRAVLVFEDSLGLQGTIYVPAPQAGLFAADGYTVDPTGDASFLINACINELILPSNQIAVVYVAGYRSRKGG